MFRSPVQLMDHWIIPQQRQPNEADNTRYRQEKVTLAKAINEALEKDFFKSAPNLPVAPSAVVEVGEYLPTTVWWAVYTLRALGYYVLVTGGFSGRPPIMSVGFKEN